VKTLHWFLLLFAATLAQAQWSQTKPLPEGPVVAFATAPSGATLAAISGTGVLSSSDQRNWSNPGNAGLSNSTATVESLANISGVMFLGTHGGIYTSADEGAHWSAYPLNGIQAGSTIFSFASAFNLLFIATDTGVYSKSGTLAWKLTAAKGFEFRTLLLVPQTNTLLAGSTSNQNGGGSGGDIWRTTDGVNWVRSNLTAFSFRCLQQDATGVIYAGAYYKFFAPGGIFVSTDFGMTWQAPQFTTKSILALNAFVDPVLGPQVQAGASDGTLYTRDLTGAWQASTGASGKAILSLLYPLLGSDGIWRSDDRSHAATNTVGQITQRLDDPFGNTFYRSQFFGWFDGQGRYIGLGSQSRSEVNDRGLVAPNGTVITAKDGTAYKFIFDSNIGGWTPVKLPLGGANSILGFVVLKDNSLMAGDWNGVPWRSVDNGDHWLKQGKTFGGISFDFASAIDPLTLHMTIYSATETKGVMFSTDLGKTWTQLGITPGKGNDNAVCVTQTGAILTARSNSTAGTVFRYSSGAWARSDTGMKSTETVMSLVCDDPSGVIYAAGGLVYQSTDDGQSWQAVASGLPKGTGTYMSVISPSRIYEYQNHLYVGFTGAGWGLWQF
jgi:hypothetical protein